VVYQTNADYVASYEVIAKNPLLVADMTEKGLLWFKFKDNLPVFILSPNGKLQVKWTNISEKRTLHRLVKNLLIAKPGEKLEMKPVKQQAWIDYPPPEGFKLYWCDEVTEFVQKTQFKEVPRIVQTKSYGTGSISDVPPLQDMLDAERRNNMRILEEARLELRYFREVTAKEFASKIGCTLESARILLYELSRFTGWEEQSEEQAQREARDAINLAGWLSWKEKGEHNSRLSTYSENAVNSASPSRLKRARNILANYPDLVPMVLWSTSDEPPGVSKRPTGKGIIVPSSEHSMVVLDWPEEAKSVWRRVFSTEPPAAWCRTSHFV
jgi:hypothetical protein